ncbi:MAG: glycosyltransferase [Patescibacteria group bacterium]|nr:glycosyltransferase [Patescibacteria group bacterium]
MKKKPLVSVIMPVYNAEKFLSQAIESILNQTYKNFEFIIIDDYSTDNSKEILKTYLKRDKRIKVFFNRKNLGIEKVLMKTKKIFRGKYYARMDADDISRKDRLEKQIDFLENNPDYVIVGSNIRIIDENNKILGLRKYPETHQEIVDYLYLGNPFAHPSVCLKADVLKKEFYNEKFKNAEDYYLWWRILKLGKGLNLQDYLVDYRFHSNQIKLKQLKNQLKASIQIQDHIFKKSNNVPFIARINHFRLRLTSFLPSRLIYSLFRAIIKK